MTADYSTLSADQFSPHIGKIFRFLAPEDQAVVFEAELTVVAERPEFTPRWAKRTSFAMKFEMPEDSTQWNGSYLVDHPVDGPMGPFYIGRTIPRNPPRACFELIFN